MIPPRAPNHRQLLGLLLRADPLFLAGSFATDFPSDPVREGERGTFLYFRGGYWYVRTYGGSWFLQSPHGCREVKLNGAVAEGPAMELPRRPPWSLVLPRCSVFLGSEEDDWQLNAAFPVTEDGGSWEAALTSMTDHGLTGAVKVCAETHVITGAVLGPMMQTLTINRYSPSLEDALALEALRIIGR